MGDERAEVSRGWPRFTASERPSGPPSARVTVARCRPHPAWPPTWLACRTAHAVLFLRSAGLQPRAKRLCYVGFPRVGPSGPLQLGANQFGAGTDDPPRTSSPKHPAPPGLPPTYGRAHTRTTYGVTLTHMVRVRGLERGWGTAREATARARPAQPAAAACAC